MDPNHLPKHALMDMCTIWAKQVLVCAGMYKFSPRVTCSYDQDSFNHMGSAYHVAPYSDGSTRYPRCCAFCHAFKASLSRIMQQSLTQPCPPCLFFFFFLLLLSDLCLCVCVFACVCVSLPQ